MVRSRALVLASRAHVASGHNCDADFIVDGDDEDDDEDVDYSGHGAGSSDAEEVREDGENSAVASQEGEESEDDASDDDSEYMADAWGSGSSSSWEPPGSRRKKKKKKKRTRRGLQRRDGPEDQFLLDESRADAFEAEEAVDAETTRSDSYAAVDLSAFAAEAAAAAAAANAVPSAADEAARAASASARAVAEEEDNRWRAAWEDGGAAMKPGQRGFNAHAVACMRKANIGIAAAGGGVVGGGAVGTSGGGCPPLQAHQEIVAFLLHRCSPVHRLLVDHPTGSGKTREMVKVLDAHFQDPRPKILIFPKQPVCRNFYLELLRWPSRYRDYYCCICPGGAFLASGAASWRLRRHEAWSLTGVTESQARELSRTCRDVLEMRGAFFEGQLRPECRQQFEARHPGEAFPNAPLRALGYATAGGANTRMDASGRPLSAIYKIGHPGRGANVYDCKVVLMDEVHNLVRTTTQYSTQLATLRDLLHDASRTVVVGFTGTPILSEPSEGQALLNIVKGRGEGACNEGFLSSLATKPRPLFPRCLPAGAPAEWVGLRRHVAIRGDALQSYVRKTRSFGDADLRLQPRRARAYCNLYAYAGTYHDGLHGCKRVLLSNPRSYAPKFQAVAEAVARRRLKSLVLVSRGTGYRAALDVVQQVAATSTPPFAVASMDQLAEFNAADNLRGERLLCLVADAFQCSEGISFNAVRMLHLVDVPTSPTELAQQCGRANRMFGHAGLDEHEQTVSTRIWISVLPTWIQDPLGSWVLRSVGCHRTSNGRGLEIEQRAQDLLNRLQASGIRSLDALKSRVDKCRSAREVANFLNNIKAGPQDGPPPGAQSAVQRGAPRAAQRAALRGGAAAPAGRSDGAPLEERLLRKRPLVCALLAMRRWPRSEVRVLEAKERAALRMTADETTYLELQRSAGDFSKALATLRAQAVDRKILVALHAAPAPVSAPSPAKKGAEAPAGHRDDFDDSDEDCPLDFFPGSSKGTLRKPAAGAAAGKVVGHRAAFVSIRDLRSPRDGGAASSGSRAAPCESVPLPPRSQLTWRKSSSPPSSGAVGDPECTESAAARSVGAAQPQPPAKRARLRGKQPGIIAAANAATESAAGGIGVAAAAGAASGGLSELLSMPVRDLRAEAMRLQPNVDLSGVLEKDELCRLVHELRSARVVAPGPAVSEQGVNSLALISTVEAAPTKELEEAERAKAHAQRLRELRSMSGKALRDLLARLRPELDVRAVRDKEELCRFFLPLL